jgi:hypothetical protein
MPRGMLCGPFFSGLSWWPSKDQRPIDGSKEKWAGTAGVAKREAAAWCEKGGNDRRGETALAGVRCELLVEEANEFFLIEAIHKAAH